MKKQRSAISDQRSAKDYSLVASRYSLRSDSRIRFGTDGWRGRVAEDFTLPNVRLVTQAIADYLKRHRPPGRALTLAVGYDTRFLGDRFAQAVAEVLAGNGIRVLLATGPTPTPTVSLTIKLRRLAGAIVVTASHNPATYNGLKFKPYYAGPAEPAMTRWVEQHLGRSPLKTLLLEEGIRRRGIQRVDLLPAYLAFVRRFINLAVLRRAHLRIAVDAMHAAGDHLVARALQGTNCHVETLDGDPHPTFGGRRPEPTGEHLQRLCDVVRRSRFDLGLATDGDADRVGVVDGEGRFVTSQETMALLALHLLENRRWRGGLAKTVAGTNLMARIAEHFRVPLYETPVGFKHVATLFRQGKVLFGGEESGGFGISRVVPERDGTLMGLLVAEMMVVRRRTLAQLVAELRRRFGRWIFQRRDTELERPLPPGFAAALARRLPRRIAGATVQRTSMMDGLKAIFTDGSWLLWRGSGTEPLLRIYAEGRSASQVKALLTAGQRLAR